MSTLPASSSTSYTLPARRPRINVRLVVLLSVLALPFLYFGYVIVDQAMHGGIKDHGSFVEVDLKSLGFFPFDERRDDISNVPQRWRNLDGKRVMLVGEMFVPGTAGDTTDEFELVYSIQKCCFNGPPKVQERVFARAPQGKSFPNLYGKVVRVVGVLHVSPLVVEGQVSKLYQMDVQSLEPAS